MSVTLDRRVGCCLAAFVACMLVVACSTDPGSEGLKTVVEQTQVSPEARFVESRSSVASGERRVYLAAKGFEASALLVPPDGFTVYFTAPSSGALEGGSGSEAVVSYEGPNPSDPADRCAIVVSRVVEPSEFRDPPPFQPDSEQVLMADFSC